MARRGPPSSSPLAASRSSAYSRIVSSIAKRGSPSACLRLAQQALVDQRGNAVERRRGARVGPAALGQTASAASSVQPPAKTARRRNSACSSAVSRSWLQAIAPRMRPLARRQVARAAGQQRAAAASSRASSAAGGRS